MANEKKNLGGMNLTAVGPVVSMEEEMEHMYAVNSAEKWKHIFFGAFHITCAIMGGGMLGLPNALSESSWYGLILLTAVTAMMGYSGILLSRCLTKVPHVHTYIDLGKEVGGTFGKYVVAVAQTVTCFGSAILFLVLAGQNSQALFESVWPGGTLQYWLIICCCILYPTIFFRTLNEAMPLSIFGVLAAVVVGIAVSIQCFFVDNRPDPVEYNTRVGAKNFATAFGTMMLSYGSHSVFPAVQREMPTQHHFKKSVAVAFPIIFSFYVVVSTIGYYTYGDAVEDNILKNLPKNVTFYIVTSAITIHVLMAYVVFMNPLFQICEYYMGLGARPEETEVEMETKFENVGNGVDSPTTIPWTKKEKIKSIVFRTIMTGIGLFISLLIPFFGDLMSFLGGSTITLSCVVVPVWFYIALFKDSMTRTSIFLHILMASIGMIVGLFSMAFSMENIIDSASSYKLFGAE
eukprot:Nk52_evm5s2473 gene=Nk52_evmTU5s2473